MADLQKTVEIIFGGKNELSSTIGEMEKDMGTLSGMADKISAPLAEAFDSVVKLDTALAALAIGGIVLATKAAADFDEQFDLIALRLKGTGANVEAFSDQVRNYAANSTQSIQSINDGIAKTMAMGVSYADALGLVNTAEQLAVSGKSDLGSAIKLLVESMNAYGASTKDAQAWADTFLTGIKNGAGTIPEMADGLGKMAGMAAAMKIPMETLVSAVASLASQGIDTGTAIAGLTRLMSNLMDPSKEARDVAAQLGVEFNATAVKTKGLNEVLHQAYVATGGNVEQMKAMFGSVRGLTVAIDLAADTNGRFAGTLDAMKNKTGIVSEIFAEESKDLDLVLQNMKNNFTLLMEDIGIKILPKAKDLGGAIADIFKSIKIGVDEGAFDPFFKYLDEVLTDMTGWIKKVAMALPEAMKGLDWSGLIQNLKDLFGAFGTYLGDLDLTKAEDLHDFIQGMIDGVASLVKVTEGMVEGFKPFFDAIVQFLQGMKNGDKESRKMAGTLMSLGKAVETFGLGLVAAGEIAYKYGVNISGAFNIIVGSIQLAANAFLTLKDVAEFAMGVIALGYAELRYVLSGFSPAWAGIIDNIKQGFNDLKKQADADAEGMAKGIDKIVRGFSDIGSQAGQTGEEIDEATRATKRFGDAADSVSSKPWGFEGGEELKNQIIDIGKEAVESSKKIVEVDKALEVIEPKKVVIGFVTDENGVQQAIYDLEKNVPKKKEVPLTLDAKTIAQDAKNIQTMIEWKAKIDIAQIEQATKIIEKEFESINLGITDTGDLISDLFGKMSSATKWNASLIEEQIEKENARREQEFELQKKLIDQQIKLNDLKLQHMEEGDMQIKIACEGLKPHLEAILWEVIAACQIRANENMAEFLIGMA